MDWLMEMNCVVECIEENLMQQIQHESLSRIVGCSVYEFSRIFSFMAGMFVSEYIRRRHLSQAVYVPAAYTRIMSEWFPASQYKRDESVPDLEVFPAGDTNSADYTWEIWMPVKSSFVV